MLDAQTGDLVEERFDASRDGFEEWATRWQGRLGTVAIKATTGWRWVARQLERRGVPVLLADSGEASARQGKRRRAKTDRLDAR